MSTTTPSLSSAPPPPPAPLPHADQHIALIGLGAIGISFLALHLTYTSATISVFDPRPDLQEHVAKILPLYLPSSTPNDTTTGPPSQISTYTTTNRLRFAASLALAVQNATIIQEQGPELLSFKQSTWTSVLQHAPPDAHLWSSTSGIPASQQLSHLVSTPTLSAQQIHSARQRLLVIHPFNPPHLMPLLELVPSPHTLSTHLTFAENYFITTSPLHRPVTIHKETTGFVANRLSFILFREACSLVARGVCTVEELDEIVRASLGPRWAVGGPFRMYNFGSERGMEGFLGGIEGAIRGVWGDVDASEGIRMEGEGADGDGGWKEMVVEQTRRAYGVPGGEDLRWRDAGLRAVVGVQGEIGRGLREEAEEGKGKAKGGERGQ